MVDASVGQDRVTFKWKHGPAVSKSDLGTPNAGTEYEVCVYDDTSSGTAIAYRGRALPPCSASPCWRDLATGWKFKSPGGADGVTKVLLRGSPVTGGARLELQAHASPLSLAPLPLAKSPSVTAQIRSSAGGCWGATFSSATRNDTKRFVGWSD